MLERCHRLHAVVSPAARRAAILLGAGLLVSACSSVPDAVNPVSWYRGVSGWVTGEPTESAERPAVAGEFPSLSTVPQRPEPVSPEARRDIMEGLVSDRANARYSDQPVRLEGTPTRPLQPAQGS